MHILCQLASFFFFLVRTNWLPLCSSKGRKISILWKAYAPNKLAILYTGSDLLFIFCFFSVFLDFQLLIFMTIDHLPTVGYLVYALSRIFHLLFLLQINMDEFDDLCNAIALRFQKEDAVSWFFCWSEYRHEALEFHFQLLYHFAAFSVREISINLQVSIFWEVEGFCEKSKIWIYHIVFSRSESGCGDCWDNGMPWTFINLMLYKSRCGTIVKHKISYDNFI